MGSRLPDVSGGRSDGINRLTGVSALLVMAFVAIPAQAATRSIQEFVAAQGTYGVDNGSGGCLPFVPPVANFVGGTVAS